MLTNEQLRQISASVEEALQGTTDEPTGLLHHLLEMASLEVCRRMKSRPDQKREAA
jgi:hypothetical protein